MTIRQQIVRCVIVELRHLTSEVASLLPLKQAR